MLNAFVTHTDKYYLLLPIHKPPADICTPLFIV
jgi:hypothetical protein